MPDPQLRTAEEEIVDLDARIRSEEQTEARQRAAGEQVKAEIQDAVENHGADRFSSENIEKMGAAFKDADEKRDYINSLRSHRAELARQMAGNPNAPRHGDPPDVRAQRGDPIARRFLESPVYRSLTDGGLLRSDSRIETGPTELLTRNELVDTLRMRATFDISQGGALIPIDQQVYPPVPIPTRQVRLLQLINVGTTNSDVVNWTQQTVRQDAATETPFGTPAPEGAFTYALKQSNVLRIPVMVPAARDQLADQGQTQTLLEGQLRDDVLRHVESQILTGSGTGNLPGITGTSGINSVVKGDGSHPSEYDLDAVHRAITAIRLSLFAEPNAIIIHPTDYESVVLQKDGQSRYIYAPAGSEGPVTIWGLMPVISPVTALHTAWVGDFRQAYTLWVREGLSVTASDGYMDFFSRGMVAIMATIRAAGAVQQPRAVTQITSLT